MKNDEHTLTPHRWWHEWVRGWEWSAKAGIIRCRHCRRTYALKADYDGFSLKWRKVGSGGDE